MKRALFLVGALSLSTLAVGCERDTLGYQPDPPDAGFPEPADAGFPDPPMDAGFVDVGFPDSGVVTARDPIYVHTGSTLYSFDIETGQTTRIGDFHTSRGPVTDVSDIAIDMNGRMFGGSVSKKIYVVHPDDATLDEKYSFEDKANGMAFLPDGKLVIAGTDVTVIDPDTGRTIRRLATNNEYETSGDIIGLPDGQLYWTVRGTNGSGDVLVRINPADGSTRRLGASGVERIYGLGYADGVLVGFSSDGTVVHLDPQNGRSSSEDMLGERWWGATTNPVRWP